MGILEQFTRLVSGQAETKKENLTHRVVLGALLSLVSRADGTVTPDEEAAKREVLKKNGFAGSVEQDEILAAAKQALAERLDWEGFTREINKTCAYEERVKLVHELFSVAWADHELSQAEIETIRKIASLLWLEHKDFIAAKLAAKPESPEA